MDVELSLYHLLGEIAFRLYSPHPPSFLKGETPVESVVVDEPPWICLMPLLNC